MELRRLHEQWKLCGEPRNRLLKAPDNLLAYVLGILSHQPQGPPPITQAQWAHFFSILDSHRVLPLLFHRLCALRPEFHPPPQIMEQMRLLFLASRARTWRVDRQLGEIIEALKENGVGFLVWKGPALARSLYPDAALRPSDDMDLLVRPGEYRRARAALEDLGYVSEAALFEGHKEYGYSETLHRFEDTGHKTMVDLLWHVHPYTGVRGRRNLHDLFERAVAIPCGSLVFHAPDPVEALITAALHMTLQHPQELRLIWIYDITVLADALSARGQWQELQSLSVQWNARLAVENALTMARLWTELQIPMPFADFSLWPEPTPHEAALFQHAVWSRDRRASLLRLYWPQSSSLRTRLRFVLRLLFPDPTYVRWKYPVSSPLRLPLSYLKCWLGWAVPSAHRRGRRRRGANLLQS